MHNTCVLVDGRKYWATAYIHDDTYMANGVITSNKVAEVPRPVLYYTDEEEIKLDGNYLGFHVVGYNPEIGFTGMAPNGFAVTIKDLKA